MSEHKKDDHGHGHDKKSFTDYLIAGVVAVLAVAIFFLVLDPLLSLAFSGATQVLDTTARGQRALAGKMLDNNVATSLLLINAFGWFFRILMAFFFGLASYKATMHMLAWAKKKPAAAAAHPAPAAPQPAAGGGAAPAGNGGGNAGGGPRPRRGGGGGQPAAAAGGANP